MALIAGLQVEAEHVILPVSPLAILMQRLDGTPRHNSEIISSTKRNLVPATLGLFYAAFIDI